MSLHLVPAAPRAGENAVEAVTSAIADGELDPHLLTLRAAIAERLDTLASRSVASALLELSPGDRVEINDKARPR